MLSFSSFFLFKKKTAFDLRISDWSSDVCSSDLKRLRRSQIVPRPQQRQGHLYSMFAAKPLDAIAFVAGHLALACVEQLPKNEPTLLIDIATPDRKSTRLNSSH